MHIKRNEAVNFFFSSPKNKTRLLKEKDNEKSPAQQGSTLKRNQIIILTVSKAQGFFFLSKKKGTSYNLPKQTNKTKDRRQRQTCTHTEQKSSHNTHTQLSTQIKNVRMVK